MPPVSGLPKNISPSFAGGTVLMVKDAIEPSGSLPPSPAIATALLGPISRLTLLAIGGWLAGVGVGVGGSGGVGVGAAVIVVVTVAPGSRPLLLSGLGSGLVEVLLAVLATVPPVAGTAKLTVLL
ncbi:hypothetical protein QUA42_27535, partial [Microcoleus sp. Pol11C2]|uniref:hypothetical protein n=1 Tax=Microcoleus sp. Pol11C2 TaxID=3055389 RepID=UPI002FD62EA5